METDVIVNAANCNLMMGGGVCGAIFRSAGEKRLSEACAEIGYCKTGDAVITPGFDLKAKYIIHTPGPIWYDNDPYQEELLYSCYIKSLRLAKKNGAESIAFPLISSGIYGCPKDIAVDTALRAFRDFLESDEMDIYLAVFDSGAVAEGKRHAEVAEYIDNAYALEHNDRDRRTNAAGMAESLIFCPVCGAPKNSSDIFCEQCGSAEDGNDYSADFREPLICAQTAMPESEEKSRKSFLKESRAAQKEEKARRKEEKKNQSKSESQNSGTPYVPDTANLPPAGVPSPAIPSAYIPAPEPEPKQDKSLLQSLVDAEIIRVCQHCGSLNKPSSKFCKACGYRLTPGNSVPASVSFSTAELLSFIKPDLFDKGKECCASEPLPESAPQPKFDKDIVCGSSAPLPELAPEPKPVFESAFAVSKKAFEPDESFSQSLLRLIDERGMTDAETYKKANIDRRLFSKIRGDVLYKPKKTTAVAFAIALELDLNETNLLLSKAGFVLSHSLKFDLIIEYFIKKKCYDMFEINRTLFEFDQPLLGV